MDAESNKVTISDVANLARVSEATVSRVINNSPTVSSGNRKAVLAAVEQLGYTPRKKIISTAIQNIAMCIGMRGLSGEKSLTGDYFSPIIQSVQAECRKRGINLLLMFMGSPGDDLKEVQRVIYQGMADSLLLVHVLEKQLLQDVLTYNVPSILLGAYFPWIPIDSVNSDSFSGMLTAMQHLLDNGHRQIVLIDGHEDSHDYWVSMHRMAYQHALAQAGIPFDF